MTEHELDKLLQEYGGAVRAVCRAILPGHPQDAEAAEAAAQPAVGLYYYMFSADTELQVGIVANHKLHRFPHFFVTFMPSQNSTTLPSRSVLYTVTSASLSLLSTSSCG